MNEFKHIRDCWNALEECTTAIEISDLLDSFPRWSGNWSMEVENGELKVTNIFYDKDADDYEMESEYYEVDLTDFEDFEDDKAADAIYGEYSTDELTKLGAFENVGLSGYSEEEFYEDEEEDI